jgi:beta-glucosidase
MRRKGRRASAIAVLALLLSAVGVGVVTAGNRSSDERALRKTRSAPSQGIESKVNALLGKMTLTEKLNQLTLVADWGINDDEAAKPVGGVFSLTDPVKINHFQHIAVEQSRLHIPILFAFDTIHGFRTIFPIPLGTASSFDPNVAADDHRIGAMESAAVGLKQIYSPMVDVSHEPRWGRSSEGAGEDPYLGSVMAAARVKAAQGDDYSAPDKVVTSVKHYVAYGQPEGGRDYNTTDMSEARLRNIYLPPFKAAIDAGGDTAMCSFNAINGVPGCANHDTETDILKKEWGFDGFIESDYTAVDELLRHGTAADGCDAARAALNAGTDMEMVSTHYRDCGQQLLADGEISMARINDAVRRILRIKFRAGLFDNPYVDVSQADAKQLLPASRETARKDAARSMVLLKNDSDTLPITDTSSSIAVIGPLGNDQHDMLGPWWGVGRDEDAVSVYDGIKAQDANTTFTEGCTMKDEELFDPANECPTVDTAAVQAAANAADHVVLALGETRLQSGEAEVRSNIELPGKQQELLDAVAATGKPVTVVLFNGRPLDLTKVAGSSNAILEAWFPGVEAGNSIADVLFGTVNPGGKLPVSFPRSVGQVPIYYNHEPTGRPCDITFRWNSRYRDIKSCDPFYEFGFGLSYTTFELSNLTLTSHTLNANGGSITATVDVQNTGSRAGDEVAQLYIHDPVASISQPVLRLRGFQRVALDPGQKTTVSWTLNRNDVGFYDNSGHLVVEPGKINVFAGDSSRVGEALSPSGLKDSFTVH